MLEQTVLAVGGFEGLDGLVVIVRPGGGSMVLSGWSSLDVLPPRLLGSHMVPLESRCRCPSGEPQRPRLLEMGFMVRTVDGSMGFLVPCHRGASTLDH